VTGVGFEPSFAPYKKDLATYSRCDGPGYCVLPQDRVSCTPKILSQYQLVTLVGVQQVSMSKAIRLPLPLGLLEVVPRCCMGVGLLSTPYPLPRGLM